MAAPAGPREEVPQIEFRMSGVDGEASLWIFLCLQIPETPSLRRVASKGESQAQGVPYKLYRQGHLCITFNVAQSDVPVLIRQIFALQELAIVAAFCHSPG